MARRSARAGPVGDLRRCSQFRSVASSIPSSSANFAWLSPVSDLTPRTSTSSWGRGTALRRATFPTRRASRFRRSCRIARDASRSASNTWFPMRVTLASDFALVIVRQRRRYANGLHREGLSNRSSQSRVVGASVGAAAGRAPPASRSSMRRSFSSHSRASQRWNVPRKAASSP